MIKWLKGAMTNDKFDKFDKLNRARLLLRSAEAKLAKLTRAEAKVIRKNTKK